MGDQISRVGGILHELEDAGRSQGDPKSGGPRQRPGGEKGSLGQD